MSSIECWASGETKTAENSSGISYEISPQTAVSIPNRVVHATKGYVTPSDGYWMSENVGREILTAWKTAEEKVVFYENKIEEILASQEAFIASAEKKTNDIYAAAKKAVASAKRPGLGVFAGGGYTTDGSVQGVVGIGLVWKVF